MIIYGTGSKAAKKVARLLLLYMFFTTSIAHATVSDLVFGNALEHLDVPINQSRILVFNDKIENVAVGNPDVADIVVLESKKLYILGKSLGTTNMVVWGRNTRGEPEYSTLNIDVVHDIDSLKGHLHDLFPEESPQIRSTQGSIILSGDISSVAKVEAISNLSKQFVRNAKKYNSVSGSGDDDEKKQDIEIINLMQVGGPHQVMLEVKIAEVSRSVLKRLGINLAAMSPGRPWKLGAVNGGSSFPAALTQDGMEVPLFPNDQAWSNLSDSMIGPAVQSFNPTTPTISAAGLFASFLSGSSYFNFILDASKDDGLAKILAEPTLTSLSGEAAEFLSGGEFPIPMWSGEENRVTVIFKEYGVAVKMLPVVLESKRINLSLNIGVSELSNTADIGFSIPNSTVSYSIPSLTTRSASSTIELMDGQTIGIAGLISEKMREAINKFPGLGDIPVLGSLFRSQTFIQDQTELVMFVTAHLAKTIDPKDIRLPTDAFKTPSDAEFFLFGRMADKVDDSSISFGNMKFAKSNSEKDANYPSQFSGPTFGHQL